MSQSNRRRMRAQTVVVRPPPPLFPALTLEDTLAAVGIRPNRAHGATHSHGLIWRWFAFEHDALAAANVAASLALLFVAMTMTQPGMALAVDLGIAPFIYRVLNDGLPWLALVLFGAALLKAAHAWLDRQAHPATRMLGYGLALGMALGALWIETMLGYAALVPWLFQPLLWLAGGETTANITQVNTALVSYFEPAVIGAAGLTLLARHFKTGLVTRAPLLRKRLALGGIALAGAVAAIAAHAALRHHGGNDGGIAFAVGGESLSTTGRGFGPLFAPGVPCHVSSLFGWRDDPLEPGKNEKHQGVDLAVKEGTPVHAMADGRVLFAEFDSGLGNFVALQPAGTGAPVIVNGHMRQLAVQAGAQVHRGEIVGYAGSTGRSTGPHVHLQLCPSGHMAHGSFICGGATNPYENWSTLTALSHMACVSGPEIF
jgi:hypothetical protein